VSDRGQFTYRLINAASMVTTLSALRVRRLQIDDFSFVRDLASRQPNFTIPPPYVLWLLLKIRNSVALIAELEGTGPIGYLLAVPVGQPKTLYVWQLATSRADKHGDGTVLLLAKLRNIASRRNTSSLMFSTMPGSAIYRAIRRNALRIFGAVPELRKPLPAMIAPHESEYCVRLRPDATPNLSPMRPKSRERS
jgi:hypothetical protein